MKTPIRHIPRQILLGLSLTLLLSGCREEAKTGQKVEAKSSKVRPAPEKPAETTTARPKRDPQTGMLMGSLDGAALAKTQGLDCLKYIFDHSSGEDREAILHYAVGYLSERHTKIQLLNVLNGLPPGGGKERLIFEIFNEKPETVSSELFSAIDALDLPEERNHAWSCCSVQITIATAGELKLAMDYLAKNSEMDDGRLELTKQALTSQYLKTLAAADPPAAAQGILAMPPDQQAAASMKLAEGWLNNIFGGRKDYDKVLEFTGELHEHPALVQATYGKCFSSIGFSVPSKLEAYLQKVAPEYRPMAVKAGVFGWVSDDPVAATEWASRQAPADQKAAAGAILEYLKKKKASEEEILPWQKMTGE